MGGSWLDHPFWRSSFKVRDEAIVRKILDARIPDVEIDTERGDDVVAAPATATDAVAAPETSAPTDGATAPTAPAAATTPPAQPVVTPPAAPIDTDGAVQATPPATGIARTASKPDGSDVRASAAEEVGRAAAALDRSTAVMKTLFNEVRLGKVADCEQAAAVVDEVSASVRRHSTAILGLARLRCRDAYTYMHSVAVCALMVGLSRSLGLDEDKVRLAGMCGLLHDIGKVSIPPRILDKPGKLDAAEWDIVRKHPRAGWDMLRASRGVAPEVLDVCLHHHERIDGKGYPDGLTGDQLSLFARMGAVCDVYDAITSSRSYKDAWPAATALRRMNEWRTGCYDEQVFAAFVKTVGIFPVGSLVRLKSPNLAVVIDQNERELSRPRVRVFYSLATQCRIPPEDVDLARTLNDGIAALEPPERWNFPDLDELWAGAEAVARVRAVA